MIKENHILQFQIPVYDGKRHNNSVLHNSLGIFPVFLVSVNRGIMRCLNDTLIQASPRQKVSPDIAISNRCQQFAVLAHEYDSSVIFGNLRHDIPDCIRL